MVPLLLMGPTASGKSALALAVCERLNGEIVNADSMQVYADLRVLSARPSPQEEALAPHHLYGIVDSAERYSVGRWREAAIAAIAEVLAHGRLPILVGGTGLYFKALTDGLADIPQAPSEVRAALAEEIEARGAPWLHARLAGLDPSAAARLSPNDAPRILRALEVLEATGEPISAWQAQTKPALAAWRGIALWPDRARLYAAIDARFETMIGAGAIEEARRLAERGLDPNLPAMKAHGAPWLIAHARGELPLQAAISLSQRDTRRYAKRQFTWMSAQMASWLRVDDQTLSERSALVEKFVLSGCA